MNRTKPMLAAAAALILLGVSGCSGDNGPMVPAPEPAGSSAPRSAPSPTTAPADTDPPVNDLEKSPLKRTFTSGGLTYNVEYATPAPVGTWTATGPKSVRLTLTALNNSSSGQKLYVNRASVRFTVRGSANEELPSPNPVVDSADINPGYLVTFPYDYEQSFDLPPLDDAATAVELDFKYEVVSLVDKKAKDYTKQTANDTVRIALNF